MKRKESAKEKMAGRQGEGQVAEKILIVDDDPLIRLGLEKLFKNMGLDPISVGTGKAALKKIEDEDLWLVLLDLKLPDSVDGLALLKIIKETRPHITVIMISGQSEIRGAVEAMKLGARDYLEKPIDFDRLKAIISSLSKKQAPPEKPGSPFDDLVFMSDKMRRTLELAQRLAVKSDMTILILGESGTGKNFICQKMHDLSSRHDFPYVQIGCANIPEHLIESELFGYERGAFTDAKESKKGLVEIAEGGTILLDELGEMPYPFQSKVLRMLEEKCFRRIGSLHDTQADVRILAATNKNLYRLVQEKKFRLDLFYRLNTASIELPPLRERREDIPILVGKFLATFSAKYDSIVKEIVPAGLMILQNYTWPGNIRQLKNLIEKLVVLSEKEEITADDITSNLLIQQSSEDEDVEGRIDANAYSGLSLQAMEEKHIRTALRLSNGNQRKAAQLLNISRDTLRYRMKRLGIEVEITED